MTIEPTPRSKKMTFLMTEETYDMLCMCSKAIGESQGEILNRLLRDYFQTHPDYVELGAQLMELERDRRKRLEAPKPKKLTRDAIIRHLNQDEWMFISQIKESLASDGYKTRTASSLLFQMYQKGILERKIPDGKSPQSRCYDAKYRLAKAERIA